jgi:hypothetical protein
MELDLCAGITIPWPVKSIFDLLSTKISALPSMIWTNVSKGEIFSANPSPASNDIRPTSPVDFLRMVLITTELSTYSIISTMICGVDFTISKLSTLPGLELMTLIIPQRSASLWRGLLHNSKYLLHHSQVLQVTKPLISELFEMRWS